MIHYPDYHPMAPRLSKEEQAANDHIHSLVEAAAEEFQKRWGKICALAVIDANGGVRPTPEEIRRKVQTLVMADGTHLLLWEAPAVEMGTKVDMQELEQYVIAKATIKGGVG